MDAAIFHFVNTTLSNAAFDQFFPWFTNIHKEPAFVYLILPILLVFVFYRFRWKGLGAIALGALLTWGLDVFIAQVIKPLFLRPRPFDAIETILRTGKPGSSSFPSGHAADSAFLAAYLSTLHPKAVWACGLVAFLIAFSRIYNGVHYPGDVGAGALLGITLGVLAARLTLRLLKGKTT